jgi:DNA-binding MurR/RpiR family transcriptional regulator
MDAETPLLALIGQRADSLSASHRRLARHLATHYQSVAFSTAAEFARACKVSEATVVRFANALGFSGYPALQKEVRRVVRADLKGTDRFQLAEARSVAPVGSLGAAISKEFENIQHLQERFDPTALRGAAAVLRGARRILVVGARATAPLAAHLWFALDKLGLPVARSLDAGTEARDRLGRMGPEDCVIVIGFPRYLRSLVALLDFAAKRGVRRIIVTDSPLSVLKGEIGLHAPAESASFVAFHAAPLILLNALVEEVAAADRAATLRALEDFEAVAESGAYFHPS